MTPDEGAVNWMEVKASIIGCHNDELSKVFVF
jgi:hypothetical protein